MTRFADYVDSAGVRAAAEEKYQRLAPKAKEGARQAADAVAPYAGTAKDTAVRYAGEARGRLAPVVTSAVGQARDALPPRVEQAVDTAARRTRSSVRTAADYTVPRVGHAVESARAAAEPVAEEAAARGAAAIAALRGQVTAADIERTVRRKARRARAGRVAVRLVVVGAAVGGAYAAWTWWNRQTNPDWLVEAPEPTEISDHRRDSFESVDGSGPLVPDPEVQAKQAEAEDTEHSGRPEGEQPA